VKLLCGRGSYENLTFLASVAYMYWREKKDNR